EECCDLGAGENAALGPPGFYGRFAEDDAGKKSGGGFEAFVDGSESVFVFDTDDIIVTGHAKGADNLLPDNFVVAPADSAEKPGTIGHVAIAFGVKDAVARDVRAIEAGIFGVHVKNAAVENADG